MLRCSVPSFVLACGLAIHPVAAQDFDITRIATPIHNGLVGNNQGIVASSFRKNGILDVAMVTNGSPSKLQVVTVLKGKADGTFEPGVQYDVGHTSEMIVEGDFNGDGKTDLAVPNFSGGVVSPQVNGDISVLLGNGDSTFQNEKRIPTSLPFTPSSIANPMWLGAADFDGDGTTDLVVAFANGQLSVLIADHGHLATFSPSFSVNLGQPPTWVGTGDFDEDGKQDFAVVLTNGTVAVYAGSGSTFTLRSSPSLNAGGTPKWGLITDLDGDHHLDIAVTSAVGGTISVLYGDGHGGFAAPYVIGVRDWPEGLAAADFDSDGVVDLAVGTAPPQVLNALAPTSGWSVGILLGSPGRTFQLPGIYFDGGPNPGLLAVGDFNQDMRQDLAVTNWIVNTSADVSIFLGKPLGKGTGPLVSSLAQVAVEGGWDTLFTMVDNDTVMSRGIIDFFGDDGNPIAFPVTTVSGSGLPLPPVATTFLDQSLTSNASVVIDGTGPGSLQRQGWAREQARRNLGVFGIFRFPANKWEAVVPLETRNVGSYYLAFDSTGGLATGVAVANVSDQPASISVIIRDDAGTQLATPTISLPGHGHTAFVLSDQYPTVRNIRGTVEFRTPTGGQISVLGLRANGGALTTLPVLASVGTLGGSIAHATYNGGFISIFYIVNTGASAAPFTLTFSDDNGSPLSVPMSLPQTSTTVMASTLTRNLAAKAMLVVITQTQSTQAAVVGSAQLTTTGNVSGFEIFQWTTFGQEASVPLETRRPNAFVLVFDDTNGLTTGVALANVGDSAAAITVNLRDESGTQLQTATINLAAHGHTSFMLPTVYSSVANVRGVVEFVVPAGGRISAVGLRAKADGTLTTIPVLEK